MDVRQRFEDKIMVVAGMEDACHLWTAQLDKDGYGQFSVSYGKKYQSQTSIPA